MSEPSPEFEKLLADIESSAHRYASALIACDVGPRTRDNREFFAVHEIVSSLQGLPYWLRELKQAHAAREAQEVGGGE